jgi:uncharacterized protein
MDRLEKDLSTVSMNYLCSVGEISKIEELILFGIDVNSQDSNLRTPSHIASKYGQVQIIKLLLKSGAILTADFNGKTALDEANS